VFFWKDFWTDGVALCDRFPRLFSFSLNSDYTVAELALSPDLGSCFALPLSLEAHIELGQVQQLLAEVDISENSVDTRSFVWGTDQYTSAKFYHFLFAAVPTDMAIRAIWKSKSLPKLKVFIWLLFRDRLNTYDVMLRRHWHLESGSACVLCDTSSLESRDHLFFDCTYAKDCWDTCQVVWDTSLPISDRFISARASFAGSCFMELFSCVTWNIWKERNDFIFKHKPPSLARWKVKTQSDILLHRYRIKPTLIQPLVDWVFQTFV
jgi:hypothetical protein